jgi:hypothetical protein
LYPLFRPRQVVYQIPASSDIVPHPFFFPAGNVYPRGNFVADASPRFNVRPMSTASRRPS